MEEPRIEWHKLGRKEWLEEIPKAIKELVRKYRFYYNSNIIIKIKNIKDVITRRYEKNKHKIILYCNSKFNICYLVAYCNNFVKIYYCTEYDFSKWYSIAYFIDKFSKAGEIEDDYEQIEEVPLFEHDRQL